MFPLRTLTVVLAATLASACSMIPEYLRPAAPVPASFPNAPQAAAATPADAIAWRDYFADVQLREVIALALANSRDLRIAALNIEQARAQYRIQRADLFPSIGAIGGGDAIPDSWMIQNFGHAQGLPGDRSRPHDDADADGMNNLQEYLAGTNPLDAQSRLKLDLAPAGLGNGQPQFSFRAVAGFGYTLLYCDDLASGTWHWLRDVPPDPTTRTVVVDDPAVKIAPARFYRVVTPMQPLTDGDTDADGIPNSWMVQHFGHPTGLAADHSRTEDDPDRDGLSNLQEFLAGTDPLNPRVAQAAE